MAFRPDHLYVIRPRRFEDGAIQDGDIITVCGQRTFAAVSSEGERLCWAGGLEIVCPRCEIARDIAVANGIGPRQYQKLQRLIKEMGEQP